MDIAVIGISGKNSIAEDMNEFHESLMNSVSGSRSSAARRGELMGIADYNEIIGNMRCMSSPELFDHQFFGIAKSEARKMTPEIRIALEFAAKAILDAGYSLKSMKGADCGVILSLSSGERYRRLIEKKDAFTYTGSTVIGMAGNQVSYRFDLRGPNFLIDSTCCSSAMGIHDAVLRLNDGECSMMLVGAVELALYDDKEDFGEFRSMGIITKNNWCSPLDKDVDGLIPGEGCGFVLLKPLDAAIRDNDHIYGVISGSASGGNGSRSRDITSPAAEAETQVMRKHSKMQVWLLMRSRTLRSMLPAHLSEIR